SQARNPGLWAGIPLGLSLRQSQIACKVQSLAAALQSSRTSWMLFPIRPEGSGLSGERLLGRLRVWRDGWVKPEVELTIGSGVVGPKVRVAPKTLQDIRPEYRAWRIGQRSAGLQG